MSVSGFDGRHYSSTSDGSETVCRDFLRKVCKRGRRCKFKHPTENECEQIRRSERIFCHDYQNSTCRRTACKFLHYSREDEELFRLTGYLPKEVASSNDVTGPKTLDEQPICKDYLNGVCTRSTSCKYRHVNSTKEQQSRLQYGNVVSVNPNLISIDSCPIVCVPPQPDQQAPSITPGILTVSSGTPSSHTFQLPRTSLLNPTDPVLTQVSSSAPPAPIVGVIDRTTLPATSVQHALYAHPPSLATFTPLVPVSTATPTVAPCSSMLAVVAEPTQHPAVLQHPSGVATSQTTYHLVSNNAAPIQHHHHHHLLSNSSSVSSTPTLLTIPLTQFACNGNQTGPLFQPPAAVACTTQHPTLLAGVVPGSASLPNTSAACFPSQNILHIDQPSTFDVCLRNRAQATHVDSTSAACTITTTISSPTSAVLAAAAAAGYLAQHLPAMAAATSSTSCIAPSTATNPHLITNPKPSKTHDSTMSAAANIPAASAAAAAAVVAATALAHSSSISTAHNRSKVIKRSKDKEGYNEAKQTDIIGSDSRARHHTTIKHVSNKLVTFPSLSTSTTTVTSAQSDPCNSTTHSAGNNAQLPPLSGSVGYLRQQHQDEENAKTAAAVAAAACIGAMFSHPITAGDSSSSSVVAMLGGLVGQGKRNFAQFNSTASISETALCDQCDEDLEESPKEVGPNSFASGDAISSDSNDGARCDGRYSSLSADESLPIVEGDLESRSDLPITKGKVKNDSSLFLTDSSSSCADSVNGMKSSTSIVFPDNSEWSNVSTPVASAAKAAAAAAVAATVAVTGSAAGFFRFAQENQQPESRSPYYPTVSSANASTRTCPSTTSSVSYVPGPEERPIWPSGSSTDHSAVKCVARGCSRKSTTTSVTPNTDDGEESECSVGFDVDSACQRTKRAAKARSIDLTHYTYSRYRGQSVLGDADFDEEDNDGFEDDDMESTISMPLSPDLQHSYQISAKSLRRRSDAAYPRHTDDSRPASCETSPSDTTEVDIWWGTARKRSKRRDRLAFERKSAVDMDSFSKSVVTECSVIANGAQQTITSSAPTTATKSSIYSSSTTFQSLLMPSHEYSTSAKTNALFRPNIRRVASVNNICAVSDIQIANRRRSNSLPTLKSQHWLKSTPSLYVDPDKLLSNDKDTNHCNEDEGNKHTVYHPNSVIRLPMPNRKSVHRERSISGHMKPAIVSNKRRRLISDKRGHLLTVYAPERPVLRRRRALPSKTSFIIRSARKTKVGTPLDSLLGQSFVGPEDMDDPVYAENEYFDDDMYRLRSLQQSHSGSIDLSHSARLSQRKRCADSNSRNYIHPSSPYQSLRAENARLRRQLEEVKRQRGDLRAANELLLEQNARLRHSSKRVSAVARMAESATKIIEAHSKTHLGRASPDASSVTCPYSEAHPFNRTATVVAAPVQQQHSNPGAISGVYVSSSMASAGQAIQNAVVTMGNSVHPVFAQSAVNAGVPGAIALSSHQPIRAVHLQASADSLVGTVSDPASSSLLHQHPVMNNFYQQQLSHSVQPLSASFTTAPVAPAHPVSSAFQVCQYSAPSSVSMFPSAPQPSIVSVGAPNTLTLLVEQAAPTSAYASIGSSHVPATLHLQPNLTLDSSPLNPAPVQPFPYTYHQGTSTLISPSVDCLSSHSVATTSVPSSMTVVGSSQTLIPTYTAQLISDQPR